MFDRRRFWAGDDRYFEGLLREYGPTVLAVARSFATDPEHTADLFQEVWRRVYANRRAFDGGGSLGAWLHRVATNVCVSDHRSRRTRFATREALESEARRDAPELNSPSPLAGIERQELRSALHRAIATLGERQQEAVVLKFMEDRDSAEIAEIMGTSVATVRSNLRHALAKLRSIIAGEDDDLS